MCAGTRVRPAERPPRGPLRPRGRANPLQPSGRHVGPLRGGDKPLAGAGDGVSDAVPRSDAVPGAPLGAGQPTVRQPERRLLGPATAVREEAVRKKHRPSGRCGGGATTNDVTGHEGDAAAADEPVNTQVTSDVTGSADDARKQVTKKNQVQQPPTLTEVEEQ